MLRRQRLLQSNNFGGRVGAVVQPLQFAAANDIFPTQTSSTFAVPSAGTGTSRRFLDSVHFFGGGDLSVIRLSWLQGTLVPAAGAGNIGNGFTIIGCAIVYNGIAVQVKFGGTNTKVINDGDIDIQSDDILPASFSVTKFTQGDPYYIREIREYTNSSTAKEITNIYNKAADSQCIAYNPAVCNPVVALLSTTPFWDGGGMSAGVFNTDFVQAPFSAPFTLGRFVTGSPKVVFIGGDSKAAGAGDTVTVANALGLGRTLYPTSTSAASAYSGCNAGCNSGAAVDWSIGTPAMITTYLKYANIGIEAYGTNALNAANSQAIHAQMRAGLVGRKHIIRLSLTPRTTGAWTLADGTDQTVAANWGVASLADTFQQAMQALVASDLTYFDSLGSRLATSGANYWKWFANGTPAYESADGLHETPQGYEDRVHTNGTIVAQSGTTTGTLKSVIDALT